MPEPVTQGGAIAAFHIPRFRRSGSNCASIDQPMYFLPQEMSGIHSPHGMNLIFITGN